MGLNFRNFTLIIFFFSSLLNLLINDASWIYSLTQKRAEYLTDWCRIITIRVWSWLIFVITGQVIISDRSNNPPTNFTVFLINWSVVVSPKGRVYPGWPDIVRATLSCWPRYFHVIILQFSISETKWKIIKLHFFLAKYYQPDDKSLAFLYLCNASIITYSSFLTDK